MKTLFPILAVSALLAGATALQAAEPLPGTTQTSPSQPKQSYDPTPPAGAAGEPLDSFEPGGQTPGLSGSAPAQQSLSPSTPSTSTSPSTGVGSSTSSGGSTGAGVGSSSSSGGAGSSGVGGGG